MKIVLVSDLHLEFAPVKLPATDADVLLLAGDIVPIAYLSERRTDSESRKVQRYVEQFIEESLSQYRRIFHIMGNHEYYRGMWETTPSEFKDYWNKKAPQVTVLHKESVQLSEGLRLWGGTLWTDFGNGNPIYMNAVQRGLNDYSLISKFNQNPTPYSPRVCPLRSEDTYREHLASKSNLEQELANFPKDRWVIMTHHAPSWRSIHKKYQGDIYNYGYASELDPLIMENSQIHTCVHGHTHNNFNYQVGSTQILCNPRGYAKPNTPNKSENEDFDPTFVFEV